MGGSKPQPPQVIPAPPAPDVNKTAAETLQAHLQYDPQLVAQQVGFQQQYGLPLAQSQADVQSKIAPQLAQSQYDVTAQYAPLYRALLESQYPQLPMLSQQITEGFQNPSGLSTQQQAAQDAIRQRAYEESARGIRSAANVGGTLYGGNSQLREDRARNELAQGFATQDIALQDQRRQQNLQSLISLFQIAGLPVQQFNAPQANVPQAGQSLVPGGDALYNALVQNNGNFGIIPGTAGTPGAMAGLLGGAGQGAGLAAGALTAAKLLPMLGVCHVAEELYGSQDIRTWLARLYAHTHTNLFLSLYRRCSKMWAKWLKTNPFLKPLVKPIWDVMWHRQFEEML